MTKVNAGISAEDIAKIVQEKVGAATAGMIRERWISKNMADLPETYKNAMPVTDDPNKLEQAEQQIRKAYREEMKEHAPKFNAPNMSKEADPKPAASPKDLSKMSAGELILEHLKNSKPSFGGPKRPLNWQAR